MAGAIAARAIVCARFGGPEVLQIASKELPAPTGKQMLLRLGAAGINPSDTYMRLGPEGPWAATPHLLPTLPFTPGKDGAGVVQKLGPEATGRFQEGDRVYTLNAASGTYAEYALCEEGDAYPLPSNVSFAQGACVGVPCSTAYRALVLRCSPKTGDCVFVHGASGAVGLAAVQLAKSLGCFVVGTAGSQAGEAAVNRAGADVVLNHRQDGYIDAAKEKTTNGRGFDICLEMMASANLVKDMKLMARFGRVAIIGSKAEPIEFNPRLVMPLELEIRGVFSPNASPEEREATQHALFEAMSSGALSPAVGMELPLQDAPKAHIEVMNPSQGGSTGNIVLVMPTE